jgi:ABC-2 type transport system permease protein
MPGWLRAFVAVNPVSLLVDAVRGLMHGTAQPRGIAVVLAIAGLLVAVFGPVTMRLFRTRS